MHPLMIVGLTAAGLLAAMLFLGLLACLVYLWRSLKQATAELAAVRKELEASATRWEHSQYLVCGALKELAGLMSKNREYIESVPVLVEGQAKACGEVAASVSSLAKSVEAFRDMMFAPGRGGYSTYNENDSDAEYSAQVLERQGHDLETARRMALSGAVNVDGPGLASPGNWMAELPDILRPDLAARNGR